MDNTLNLFFEQILNEATAFDVWDQTFKGKLTPEEFLSILRIDPTSTVTENPEDPSVQATLMLSKKGSYTDWIIRQYKAQGNAAKVRFLTEDAQQIRKYLEVYKALTSNKEGLGKLQSAVTQAGLQIANVKDLNQFKLDTLITVLTPFLKESMPDLSIKDENKITVVYNDPVWQVVIPLTHAASRKYGTGTHWCTATSNNSYYKSYSKQGPLYIIRAKQIQGNDCRWQYHKQSSQFMDWKDNSISIRRFLLTFLPRWPESTTAMAKTISVFAQSPAWDPDRLQKETAKELEKIKKAIRDADNDVDETVYGGEPLLIYAITRNDTNILDMLLTQYKADPIVYDSKGRSAIEIAIIVGNTDAVKMLLQHSSSPEMMLSQRGTDGDTPIHQVAQRLNLPLLNFFLEHLPTPQMRLTYLNTRNNLRQTPLMRAIHDSHGDEDSILDIVKIIVETMEASVQGTTSSQLSETIRRFIEDDTIEDIVDRPARHILDLRDLSGCTAAVYALRSGYLKVYKYLVEHGSNINAARHDAVVKTVDQLGNKELLEFVTSGATMFDVFETVPVTVQFLNNLAQLTGSAGDNEDTDDRNNIVSSDILAQQIVDAFDYLMKKAAKSPQAKNRRATKTPHFYLLTGGSKRSFGSNDSDPGTSLAHQLGKCMESAIARGNLPLVKYLHETWNVSMQPCGDTEDTGHTVDGINILIDQSAYIPFSISKPIIDYILSQGGSLVPILEYYSNREDNIRDFFSDIEDKNLLMYLLEQVGKVAPKSIKTLFAGAPVHKILRMFWHDVFNSTGSVSADKHRFERYYETLGTIPPYTVPEDEIPAIFEEYVPLLELAITANPESITTKKSEFLAFQSATILMCYLTQARPIMPFIVEWLFEHGAPKDTVDRTLGSVYGATVSNMIYITKKNLSMTQVIDMVKEYRGYFEHLKKLVGNVPAYYNIVTASIHGGRDKETLLDKMLGAAYVEVKLAKNPEFKAWIQDIRDEGALMYEEIQSATKTTETPPESVDSNNKPKKPAPSPYEQYHANIAEKYEDYDDEGNEIERDDD